MIHLIKSLPMFTFVLNSFFLPTPIKSDFSYLLWPTVPGVWGEKTDLKNKRSEILILRNSVPKQSGKVSLKINNTNLEVSL